MTRSCGPHPELVGATLWLPAEPFEYGWAPLVGCNRLRCSLCGQPVSTRVLDDGKRRHYECRCQRHDEIWRHAVDSRGDIPVGPAGWRCEGHPDLALPATLDGVALAEDGDWGAVARQGLGRPPFRPPRVELPAVWITRLYRLLAGEAARQRLSEAVADAAGDTEPAVVAGALDFFLNEPSAPGAERLAAMIPARRAWLDATAHPERRGSSLLETAALALHERLLVVDGSGRPVDGAALALAEALALDGIGPGAAPYTFHDYDPDWLWDHAGELVRAHADWLERIVQLSGTAPAARRRQALLAIARVGEDARRTLCAEITDCFEDPERSALLSSIAQDAGARDTGA